MRVKKIGGFTGTGEDEEIVSLLCRVISNFASQEYSKYEF
jgi:hypothetical protein